MPLLNLLLNLMTLLNEFLRHLEKFGLSVSSPRDLGENLKLQRDGLPKISRRTALVVHSSALSTSTDGLSL